MQRHIFKFIHRADMSTIQEFSVKKKELFKAVLKYPLSEAKLSNALLKLIFLTKVHVNWMHDY